MQSYVQSTFSSLGIRNYRIFFWAQLASLSGNWVRLVAVTWLVLQLHASGTMLGIVTGLQFLPSLLIGPVAGVVADRMPKRQLIAITQSVMGLCSLALAIIVGMHIVQLWMVMAIVFVAGIANAFDMPACQTLIADLVDKTHVRNAITLEALESNVARIIGPSIGAICLTHFTITSCFAVDTLSFVCTLIAIGMLRPHEFFANKIIPRAKGQFHEGWAYLRQNATVRTILLTMTLVGTFACEFFVTLPLLAKVTLHGDATTYAAMTTAMGSGAIAAGLYIARKATPMRVETLAQYAMIMALSMVLTALTPSYGVVLLMLFVVGASQLALTTSANTMLMLHTSPAMRGRMSGWWVMIFVGSTPIGGPLMGWVAQVGTPGLALIVGASATAIAGGWMYARRPVLTPAT